MEQLFNKVFWSFIAAATWFWISIVVGQPNIDAWLIFGFVVGVIILLATIFLPLIFKGNHDTVGYNEQVMANIDAAIKYMTKWLNKYSNDAFPNQHRILRRYTEIYQELLNGVPYTEGHYLELQGLYLEFCRQINLTEGRQVE